MTHKTKSKTKSGVRLAILRFSGLGNSPAWLLPVTSPPAPNPAHWGFVFDKNFAPGRRLTTSFGGVSIRAPMPRQAPTSPDNVRTATVENRKIASLTPICNWPKLRHGMICVFRRVNLVDTHAAFKSAQQPEQRVAGIGMADRQ